VQFSPDLREPVATGVVSLSIRLWQTPKVRVGGRYPVAGATIEVDSMELVPFSVITDADIRCRLTHRRSDGQEQRALWEVLG
jgi:hypothetical protein